MIKAAFHLGIRLAIILAKCGHVCAKAEATVKNAVFDTDRNDPDTCWPRGIHLALWCHRQALETHLVRQTGHLVRQFPRPATKH